MATISINENKFGFTIQRKNKTSLKFEAKNCICMKSIQKNDSMWFIKIKIPNDIYNIIKNIEIQSNNIINNYKLLSSIDEDLCMNIKIPYRYKKFECDFYDNYNQRITSDELKESDNLTINIECLNIWKNDGCFSLTWKTKFIKKM